MENSTLRFDPCTYRQWYESPLGMRVEADEKHLIFELAKLCSGEQVLDIGCGDGSFTEMAARLAGCAVGMDRSAEMLKAGAERLDHISPWNGCWGMRQPFHLRIHVLMSSLLSLFWVWWRSPELLLKKLFGYSNQVADW